MEGGGKETSRVEGGWGKQQQHSLQIIYAGIVSGRLTRGKGGEREGYGMRRTAGYKVQFAMNSDEAASPHHSLELSAR